MRRIALLLFAIGLSTLGAAGAASAYPINPPTVDVSNDAPAPGGTITLTANAFCPGATVTFTVNGSVVGSAVADQTGHATLVIAVPDTPGTYNVLATSPPECGLSAGSQFSVTPISTVPLPVTGANSSFPLQIGGLTLLAGVGLVSVAAVRRRKPVETA